MRPQTSTRTLVLLLLIGPCFLFAQGAVSHETQQSASTATAKSPGAPKCSTAGEEHITIECTYTATPRSDSNTRFTPRVVLNRAVLSLEPKDESQMVAELTFTNESSGSISGRPTVYLAVDDDQGRNYVRRPLPSVDFSKLKPGEPQTFSDQLRIEAFRPLRYTIHLWIPNPDPSVKFKAEHNLLLSSVGVADPVDGLNVLAQFTVEGWKQRTR